MIITKATPDMESLLSQKFDIPLISKEILFLAKYAICLYFS